MTPTPNPALEDRLRRCLHDQAVRLPPPSEHEPRWETSRPHKMRTRTFLATAATIAALAAIVGGVALAGRDSGSGADDLHTTDDDHKPTDPATAEKLPANGQLGPGQAIFSGNELHIYDTAGNLTDSITLEPGADDIADGIDQVTTDRQGGWVGCNGPGTYYWFRAGAEPVKLETPDWPCLFIGVVDTPQGPALITTTPAAFDRPPGAANMSAIFLETGEPAQLKLPPDGPSFFMWTAAGDRILRHSEEAGFELFDLTSGEALPLPGSLPSLGEYGDLVLSPDGSTLAVISGAALGPGQLVVYDLTSGAELFHEDLTLPGRIDLAYDGKTVAYGSRDANDGPVTVIDIASGERYTIDDHGQLP